MATKKKICVLLMRKTERHAMVARFCQCMMSLFENRTFEVSCHFLQLNYFSQFLNIYYLPVNMYFREATDIYSADIYGRVLNHLSIIMFDLA